MRLSFLADANQCMRVSSALEAGTVSDTVATARDARILMVIAGVSIPVTQVWVNQYSIVHNNVPFGGKKQSGIGTESVCSLRARYVLMRLKRPRARKTRSGRIHFGQGRALELWGERLLATLTHSRVYEK